MKVAIIILTIIAVLFKLISTGCANYIRNDKKEKMKYVFSDGGSTLGIICGLTNLVYILAAFADGICVLILLLGLI